MDAPDASFRKPVLLVEDNIDDAFRFAQTLRALGGKWDLFSVPDMESATRYLMAAAADENCRPAAVFVDLTLGTRDGNDLIAWIRSKAHLRACSVFAISGRDDDAGQERARLRGANDFLPKPVSGSALALTLARFAATADNGPAIPAIA